MNSQSNDNESDEFFKWAIRFQDEIIQHRAERKRTREELEERARTMVAKNVGKTVDELINDKSLILHFLRDIDCNIRRWTAFAVYTYDIYSDDIVGLCERLVCDEPSLPVKRTLMNIIANRYSNSRNMRVALLFNKIRSDTEIDEDVRSLADECFKEVLGIFPTV